MMCNGEFRDKNPEDALDYLDQLAENANHDQVEESISLGKIMIYKHNLHP